MALDTRTAEAAYATKTNIASPENELRTQIIATNAARDIQNEYPTLQVTVKAGIPPVAD